MPNPNRVSFYLLALYKSVIWLLGHNHSLDIGTKSLKPCNANCCCPFRKDELPTHIIYTQVRQFGFKLLAYNIRNEKKIYKVLFPVTFCVFKNRKTS